MEGGKVAQIAVPEVVQIVPTRAHIQLMGQFEIVTHSNECTRNDGHRERANEREHVHEAEQKYERNGHIETVDGKVHHTGRGPQLEVLRVIAEQTIAHHSERVELVDL